MHSQARALSPVTESEDTNKNRSAITGKKQVVEVYLALQNPTRTVNLAYGKLAHGQAVFASCKALLD